MTYDNIKSATKNQGFTLSLSLSLSWKEKRYINGKTTWGKGERLTYILIFLIGCFTLNNVKSTKNFWRYKRGNITVYVK